MIFLGYVQHYILFMLPEWLSSFWICRKWNWGSFCTVGWKCFGDLFIIFCTNQQI